jgi:hypothetical protein
MVASAAPARIALVRSDLSLMDPVPLIKTSSLLAAIIA